MMKRIWIILAALFLMMFGMTGCRPAEQNETGTRTAAEVITAEQAKKIMEQNEVLQDKDQLILVYCRSGRRSAIAAKCLTDMGYTNVKDFGGMIDWPYEVVTE